MPRDIPAGDGLIVSNHQPGGVLALDPSSEVGWCYGHAPQALLHGSWKLVRAGEGARAAGFSAKLGPFLEAYEPADMVLESPLPPHAHTATWSARQQYGLNWQAHLEAFWSSCAVHEVDVLTARDAVMGQRRFSKDGTKREVVQFCRRRGIRVTTHHAADAVVLWLWFWQRTHGLPRLAGPLWREVAA